MLTTCISVSFPCASCIRDAKKSPRMQNFEICAFLRLADFDIDVFGKISFDPYQLKSLRFLSKHR